MPDLMKVMKVKVYFREINCLYKHASVLWLNIMTFYLYSYSLKYIHVLRQTINEIP